MKLLPTLITAAMSASCVAATIQETPIHLETQYVSTLYGSFKDSVENRAYMVVTDKEEEIMYFYQSAVEISGDGRIVPNFTLVSRMNNVCPVEEVDTAQTAVFEINGIKVEMQTYCSIGDDGYTQELAFPKTLAGTAYLHSEYLEKEQAHGSIMVQTDQGESLKFEADGYANAVLAATEDKAL